MVDRLEEFMRGMSAAVELRNRAGAAGCFVESICLAATIVDAQLRIGIILQHQIQTRSSEILNELLFQAPHDKKLGERAIYKRARRDHVITQTLFKELDDLYEDRNRTVHRYIITEITTSEVLRIALDYERAITKVCDGIARLERRQIELGVGMTRYLERDTTNKMLEEFADAKHGDPLLAAAIRQATGSRES